MRFRLVGFAVSLACLSCSGANITANEAGKNVGSKSASDVENAAEVITSLWGSATAFKPQVVTKREFVVSYKPSFYTTTRLQESAIVIGEDDTEDAITVGEADSVMSPDSVSGDVTYVGSEATAQAAGATPIYSTDGTFIGACPAGYSCSPGSGGVAVGVPISTSGCTSCGKPATVWPSYEAPTPSWTVPSYSAPSFPSVAPPIQNVVFPSAPATVSPTAPLMVGPPIPGLVSPNSGVALPTVTRTATAFASGGGAAYSPAPSYSSRRRYCPPRCVPQRRGSCLQRLFNRRCQPRGCR